MIRIRQKFEVAELTDVKYAVRKEIFSSDIASRVHPGDRIAIGTGSRGIYKIDVIVATVLETLKELGAFPFLIPAMGSHGGATPLGQRQVLASYNITESSMGVRIDDSMETVFLGKTKSSIPVYFSKAAYNADWVLPINRVKVHTDFSGPIESGLIKMLAIGMGKEKGATALHHQGTVNFAWVIPEVGKTILSLVDVRFGIAILENSYSHTAMIEVVKGEDMIEHEKLLLKKSKEMLPTIPFSKIDILIVEEFGKDISGTGMDPNITGRRGVGTFKNFVGPEIQQIIVLHLTKASHGNAVSINTADFITRDFFEQINFQITYKNALACGDPSSAKIPVIADNEREAIKLAIGCCKGIDPVNARIVRIQNTLKLEELLISESLLNEARCIPNVEILNKV